MFGEFSPRLRGAQSLSATPAGTVIDWWQPDAHTSVPAGWSLCDGQIAIWQTGPRAGQGFIKPNLIGMYTVGGDVLNGVAAANTNGFGSSPAQSVAGATAHQHEYTVPSNAIVSGNVSYVASALGGYFYTYAASSAPAALVTTKLIKL